MLVRVASWVAGVVFLVARWECGHDQKKKHSVGDTGENSKQGPL